MDSMEENTPIPPLAWDISLPLGVLAETLDLGEGVRAALGDRLVWAGRVGSGDGVCALARTPRGHYVLWFTAPRVGRENPADRLLQLVESLTAGVVDPLIGPYATIPALVEALAEGFETANPVDPPVTHLALAVLTRRGTGVAEAVAARVRTCVESRSHALGRYLQRVDVRLGYVGREDRLADPALAAIEAAWSTRPTPSLPVDLHADLATRLLAVPRSAWDQAARHIVGARA